MEGEGFETKLKLKASTSLSLGDSWWKELYFPSLIVTLAGFKAWYF